MKIAKIAALALLTATPMAASAQQADPFVSSYSALPLPAIAVIGGVVVAAAIVAGAGDSGSDSSTGTID